MQNSIKTINEVCSIPLVKVAELLGRAEENKCAVGEFSVGNMEMIIGAVKAAEEMNTPIILQIAEKSDYFTLSPLNFRRFLFFCLYTIFID